LREQILPELEKARQAKLIGKSLEAQLKLGLRNGVTTWIVEHLPALQELLNVSQIRVQHQPAEGAVEHDVRGFPSFEVARADGQKCERCWHYELEVGQNSEHPTLCARCITAVNLISPTTTVPG